MNLKIRNYYNLKKSIIKYIPNSTDTRNLTFHSTIKNQSKTKVKLNNFSCRLVQIKRSKIIIEFINKYYRTPGTWMLLDLIRRENEKEQLLVQFYFLEL